MMYHSILFLEDSICVVEVVIVDKPHIGKGGNEVNDEPGF